MANFLQLDLDGYNNPFVLKHLGAAIVAIAADLEKEYATHPAKDACACLPSRDEVVEKELYAEVGVRQDLTDVVSVIVPPTIPAPPAITPFQPTAVTPPAPPVESVQVYGGTPLGGPEVIEDEETGWPDPPGGAAPTTSPLDVAGIPWDARIHAGSKARMKADNTWKLKPGVDKALVEQVKAELLGVQAVPVPPPAPPATLADAAAVSIGLQGNDAIAPPPVAAPPAPSCPANFAELIKEVTTRITAGTMTADQVNAACVTVGLQMCNQLAARQDLIPAVWSVLCPTHG